MVLYTVCAALLILTDLWQTVSHVESATESSAVADVSRYWGLSSYYAKGADVRQISTEPSDTWLECGWKTTIKPRHTFS